MATKKKTSSKSGKAKATKPVSDKQRKNSDGRQRSLANLKPFQPGQSGNPAGRPAKRALSEWLRDVINRPDEVDSETTFGEQIALTLARQAIKGNVQAAQTILDRLEGRPKQSVDLSVSRTEADRYEKMITRLLDVAAANGTPITREEAIQYLATQDNKILALLNEGSVTGH